MMYCLYHTDVTSDRHVASPEIIYIYMYVCILTLSLNTLFYSLLHSLYSTALTLLYCTQLGCCERCSAVLFCASLLRGASLHTGLSSGSTTTATPLLAALVQVLETTLFPAPDLLTVPLQELLRPMRLPLQLRWMTSR